MNAKLLAVIRREYLQHVRTKAFWIATLLIPTVGLVFVFIQMALAKTIIPKGRIAVVDLTGRLYEPLVDEQHSRGLGEDVPEKGAGAGQPEEQPRKPAGQHRIEFERVEATPESLPALRKRLNEEVQTEKLKAYMVLDAKTMETGSAEWRAQSVKADLVLRESIASLLTRAVTKERLKDRGVDPKVYDAARVRVELDVHEAKEVESGESGKNAGFNLAVSGVFFFLIYLSIFVYGAYIMRGVLEEKNNRIVEVIISSVRPTDLMLGKIIGIGLVGLTQYAVWAVIALNLSLPGLMGAVGLGTEALPPIPVGTVAAFVVFFLLGYFLYASLYAALAAPFNSEQEAQQFLMIPVMLLVLTSTTWFFAFNTPNGPLAVVLSFFPFTSPLMMFMRISVQTPPAWQIALSIGLLVAAVWGMAWVAGRIYRVGILMYGKKPTLPEIARWAAQAD